MSTKILSCENPWTGASGYIGGTVLETITSHHPEYDITVLLNNTPDNFHGKYPNIKIIKGDFDSINIITHAASQANIVIRIINTLVALSTSLASKLSSPVSFSDPGLLFSSTLVAPRYSPTLTNLGKFNPKISSDISDIEEITSERRDALPHAVGAIIQAAAAQHGERLKTAIACPPDIYRKGKGGPDIPLYFVPMFLDEIKSKKGFWL